MHDRVEMIVRALKDLDIVHSFFFHARVQSFKCPFFTLDELILVITFAQVVAEFLSKSSRCAGLLLNGIQSEKVLIQLELRLFHVLNFLEDGVEQILS